MSNWCHMTITWLCTLSFQSAFSLPLFLKMIERWDQTLPNSHIFNQFLFNLSAANSPWSLLILGSEGSLSLSPSSFQSILSPPQSVLYPNVGESFTYSLFFISHFHLTPHHHVVIIIFPNLLHTYTWQTYLSPTFFACEQAQSTASSIICSRHRARHFCLFLVLKESESAVFPTALRGMQMPISHIKR